MLTESARLDEKLGNLAQLNLGRLGDLLKQDMYRGVGNKFTGSSSYYYPGNTSKIIDAGVLKEGLKSLRKAYRDAVAGEGNISIAGFALYLKGQTVAFGLFSDLAGSRPEGKFAYDLTAFEEQLRAQTDRENETRQAWNKKAHTPPTSAFDKEDYEYEGGHYTGKRIDVIRKFVGSSKSVGELAVFMDQLTALSAQLGAPVTCKLVTTDREGSERGQQRRQLNRNEVVDAVADLKRRLTKYKNSKRPTAENIHQFLEMVTSGAASVVNFGGRPWKASARSGASSSKIDPLALLSGTPFEIDYSSADPGSYDSIKIGYRFDRANNTLTPWQARWTGEDRREKSIVLDPKFWIQQTLGVKDLEKPTVVRKMLTLIKDSPGSYTFDRIEKAINAMRNLGEDWPEFGVIEKSISAERAKEAAKKQ
jgi:hypothetical protein